MDRAAKPVERDLVLIGGGHAHVAVLKSFGMNPNSGLRVTLITRSADTPYSGMLPGYIAGHYRFSNAHIDLHPLCRFAGAQLYVDEVTGLDANTRTIHCAHRPPVHYDILSIDTGSTPTIGSIPGAAKFAIPIKPVEEFLVKWREVVGDFEKADGGTFRIVIVGAGAGGVEVALAAQHRLQRVASNRERPSPKLEIHVVSNTDSILTSHNRSVQKKYLRILREREIHVHLDSGAEQVVDGHLKFEGNNELAFDYLLWVTHASAPKWIEQSGVRTNDEGFIAVEDTLRSASHPEIFAAGDVASVLPHQRPKSGVFAVRQGAPLARNLRRAVAGLPPLPFKPQKRFLSLISTGDRYAVGSKGAFAIEGKWVWRWKDWIDRRWMRRYQELPEMKSGGKTGKPNAPEFEPMRCGGCGSKVGSDILQRVLNRIDSTSHAEEIVGFAGRDDAAAFRVPTDRAVVQSVDFFKSFVSDPFLFGKIAANHCLNDLYATNAEPRSAQVIATVPFGTALSMEEQLFQLMSGLVHVLNENDVSLLGGHTSEGDALAMGLCVNGYGEQDSLFRKSGAQPGDALILTHPIGSGCIFAADMRAKAEGSWVREAVAQMLQSRKEARDAFAAHRATACTDITGFGLLGHLVELLTASGVDATINFDDIAVLAGAKQNVAHGIESSLAPENRRFERFLSSAKTRYQDGGYPLLFDPQTAGGLFASVPPGQAGACLEALQSAGYTESAIIGETRTRTGDSANVDLT